VRTMTNCGKSTIIVAEFVTSAWNERRCDPRKRRREETVIIVGFACVSAADAFRASTRVHIVDFSQAIVNDRGGRTHDALLVIYICNVRATYLSFTTAMRNGREDRSLGNGDWFFRRDFYLDIVCGNFLAAFAPIRRFVRRYSWTVIQLRYFLKLLSFNGDYDNAFL